jgi:hypothetical protein
MAMLAAISDSRVTSYPDVQNTSISSALNTVATANENQREQVECQT